MCYRRNSEQQQHTDLPKIIGETSEEADFCNHMSQCNRLPLDGCSTEDFEQDLYQFLSARGEQELVRLLRNRRITCNNSPLDVFGLYREVIRRGGLVDNQRYDDYNRWTGSINFAGQIFPRMTNYTPNNRATSIGNQLLSNYRKFLLAYEIVHRPRDLEGQQRSETRAPSGLDFLADIASGEANGIEVDMLPRKHQAREPAALEQAAPAGRQQPQAEQRSDSLQEGQLILAKEGSGSKRQWPVIVAGSQDLPYVVLQGESTSPMLPTAQQAKPAPPSSSSEDILPVCIFGAEALGWVHTSACQLYTSAAGESALLQVQAHRQKNDEDVKEWLLNEECSKALKCTAQYVQSANQQEIPLSQLVRQASTQYLAAKLLAMEAAMPSDGVYGQWHYWREQVRHASKPEHLVHLVLMLAQQAQLCSARSTDRSMDISAILLAPTSITAHLAPHTTISSLESALDIIDQDLNWSNVLGPKSHVLCCKHSSWVL